MKTPCSSFTMSIIVQYHRLTSGAAMVEISSEHQPAPITTHNFPVSTKLREIIINIINNIAYIYLLIGDL